MVPVEVRPVVVSGCSGQTRNRKSLIRLLTLWLLAMVRKHWNSNNGNVVLSKWSNIVVRGLIAKNHSSTVLYIGGMEWSRLCVWLDIGTSG